METASVENTPLTGLRRPDRLTQASNLDAWFATAFIALIFALPTAIGTVPFAAVILITSAIYLYRPIRTYGAYVLTPDYVVTVAVVLLYLGLSASGVLRPFNFGFDRSRIIEQAAGIIIALATLPAFTEASRVLLARNRWGWPMLVLGSTMAVTMLTFRLDEGMLTLKGMYGALAPNLLVHFLYLAFVLLVSRKPFIRVLLLLITMPFMAAASNQLITISLIILVALRADRLVFWSILFTILLVDTLMAFQVTWIVDLFSHDANSMFRIHAWGHAFDAIGAHIVGAGYGTTFSNLSAMRDPVMWWVYSGSLDRVFEVANHNTYIDLTFRLGLLGIAAFAALLAGAAKSAAQSRYSKLGLGALLIAVVACGFNPIIEAIRAAAFVGFAFGFARACRLFPRSRQADAHGALPTFKSPAFAPANGGNA